MSFPEMLYSFFLMPIQLLFEPVFSYAYMLTGEDPGLAIIALSLAINLLVLPLYRRADMMQEEARILEAKLHDGVAHIKKTFHGDEKTMILQTYYRQNNYSPLYVLRSAVSLFLEIPFFIAAYQFLSGLTILNGVSFGPISDLSKPDGLIPLGGLSVNLLPILMTAINVVSTVIFTKGYPLKTKIQLYGMAAFFLVFLYDSPSGLVFYWTLNNLFSLVKTIFYKIKDPKKVLKIMLLCIGGALMVFGVVNFFLSGVIEELLIFEGIGALLAIPFFVGLIKKKTNYTPREFTAEPNKKLFRFSTIFLAVLTGILIPSAVITASPQEFLIVGTDLHPVWYVVSSFLTAAGMFILWLGVFYWLFSDKAKVVFERIMLIMCGAGTINYLFFGNDFGTLTADLVYDNDIRFTLQQLLINLLLLVAVSCALLFVAKKHAKIIQGVLLTATLTVLCMAGINTVGIFNSVAQIDMDALADSAGQPKLTLSKDGKNVVVIMLDRAMGEYVPYIMDDKPELKDKFSGFTYYSNVVSSGGYTNFGVPAVFGGYEYTTYELNKRDDESLESKHNEALKVMPALFDENGYKTTVCDPSYAGYKQIPDLTIYNDYPDINRYITQGTVISEGKQPRIIPSRYRNFFCFSMMKIAPPSIQLALYDSGHYHQMTPAFTTFEKSYEVLKNMSRITKIDDSAKNCFVMMTNESTHNFVTFKDDDLLEQADTLSTDPSKTSLTHNGIELDLSGTRMYSLYITNVASYMRLCEWFDYLKEQGVYDNTRIILCSDHGRATQQIEELFIDSSAYDSDEEVRYGDVEFFYPLLMVKDFNSKGAMQTDDRFMTNADVPTLAMKDVISDPVNPFTGKAINDSEKTAHDQYVLGSDEWDLSKNDGNTFLPGKWYSVHDSIWNPNNWKLLKKNAVLPD